MNKIIKRQILIKYIKDNFEKLLARKLNLIRVSAPLLVLKNSNLNDDLGLKDSGIVVHSKALNEDIEIIQSLAKWKRMALYKYNFPKLTGLYTDMNAIRINDPVDKTHSLYVDQWDWEQVITKDEYNLDYLKLIVKKIYDVIKLMNKKLVSFSKDKKYQKKLPKEITFISANELYNLYSNLDSKLREDEIAREKGVVFIYQIGHNLANGESHSNRAFDYDNWDLNGDLIAYSNSLNEAIELSSMGIRVTKAELIKQAAIKNISIDFNKEYYQLLNNETLPLTIGGGIGQSRLCQYLLDVPHIGMVQASIFSEEDRNKYKEIL